MNKLVLPFHFLLRVKNFLFIFSILINHSFYLQATNYYINNSGNDSNNGDINNPWETLTNINSIQIIPGDSIFLAGGQTFSGNIYLDNLDAGGGSGSPVVFNTYGNGRASIYSDNSFGFYLYNTAGIEIRNINLSGSGYPQNNQSGILFYCDSNLSNLEYIRIDSCDVSGYGIHGICLLNYFTPYGYSNINFSYLNVFNNARSGVTISGYLDYYSHSNVLIEQVLSHDNFGDSTYTASHSGNGIVIGGTDTLLIQNCEAYHNGIYNRHAGGGPVGIWMWNTRNGIIQFCESHHNFAGLEADGGGFDIDGGSQNCILQYNYSHDNEGAGLAFFEYGSSNEFINNTIRYNISQNDARKNGIGGISLWGVDSLHRIKNSFIYNNTIFVDSSNLTDINLPKGISFYNDNFEQVTIANNIIYVDDNLYFTNTYGLNIDTSKVLLANNLYYSSGGQFQYNWDTLYTSINAFRGTGQETFQSSSYGIEADPFLTQPGIGGTIGIGNDLTTLIEYQILPNSPAINAGINIDSLFGIDPGLIDYYTNSLSSTADIGAHEFQIVTSIQSTEHSRAFSIYPNPAENSFRFVFDATIFQPEKLRIYSPDGKVIKTVLFDHEISQIDISDLNEGIYFIIIGNSDQEEILPLIKK